MKIHTKKVIYLFVVLLTMGLLVGCGARLSSKINFNEDGSGERIVNAHISGSDIAKINGGLDKLDEVLNSSKPEFVNISRYSTDNEVIYEFKYDFSDIEEYNEKTSQIIGEKHNSQFSWTKSLFGMRCTFSEPNVLYDVIKWAIDAVDDSNIVNYSRSDLYDLSYTTVNTGIDSKSYSSSTSMISYEYNDTYPIERIEIETDVSFNDQLKRELNVVVTPFTLEKIGHEKLVEYLNSFYDGFQKIEKDGEIIYHVTLNTENKDELKDIMKPISTGDSNYFIVEEDSISNLLHRLYRIKENFNVKKLIEGTYANEGVLYKIHLPGGFTEDILLGWGHVYRNEEIDGKRIIEVRYDENNPIDCLIELEKRFYVDNIQVNLDIEDSKKAVKEISYVFSRDTSSLIGEEEFDKYFKEINENIEVVESGSKRIYKDNMNISTTYDDNQKHFMNDGSLMFFKKSEASNLKKNVYILYDSFSFDKILGYLPVNENIFYTLNIPKHYNVLYIEKNGEEVTVNNIGENKGKDTKEPVELTFDLKKDNNVEIKLIIEKENNIIWIIMIGAFIVVIVVVFIIFRKQLLQLVSKIRERQNQQNKEELVKE